MSMHSPDQTNGFSSDFDGSIWPAIWVTGATLCLATLAWVY